MGGRLGAKFWREQGMPSWSLALEGARREVAGLKGLAKGRRVAWFGYFAAKELLSTVKLVPFALRSITARAAITQESLRRLTEADVSVARHQYGELERNLVDVYTPEGPQQKGLPVVLFVHGGVWSSGELWHYSAMGADLARQNCVVVVATYNFYPDVLVPHQVNDVDAALRWTEENCERFGGSREKISVVGHSSGAHLSLMAVLKRAGLYREEGKGDLGQVTVPRSVVLMAGVYDIERHYEYERRRGVHSLSAMARAHGGHTNFAGLSPARLLSGDDKTSKGVDEIVAEIDAYEGERADLQRTGDGVPGGLLLSKPKRSKVPSSRHEFPRVFLMSGLSDDVVPWYWSNELAQILDKNSIQFSNTVYKGASHLDFIACFNRNNKGFGGIKDDLVKIRRDLLSNL